MTPGTAAASGDPTSPSAATNAVQNGYRQPTQMATTSRPATALRQQPAIDRMFDWVRPAAKAKTVRRLRGRGVGRAEPRRRPVGVEAYQPLLDQKGDIVTPCDNYERVVRPVFVGVSTVATGVRLDRTRLLLYERVLRPFELARLGGVQREGRIDQRRVVLRYLDRDTETFLRSVADGRVVCAIPTYRTPRQHGGREYDTRTFQDGSASDFLAHFFLIRVIIASLQFPCLTRSGDWLYPL